MSSIKEKLLFISIGQAGGNIIQLFENEGYNCLFINTSNDDLQTINAKHKLFLTGATGCAKNRSKALEYAKEHYQTICNVIESKFSQQEIVNVVFSVGGGSGSGISPVVLDILSSQYPNKSYNAIIILPSLQESIKCQANAIECYNQLVNIENLKGLYIIDNSKAETNIEKFNLNNQFFNLFHSVINITIPDPRGIIDESELETLLTCKGNSIIISSEYSNDINEILSQSIFASTEYGCEYVGLSIKNDINIDAIQHQFGNYIDIFQGYNDKSNIIIIVGIQYPSEAINKLINSVNQKKDTLCINPIKNNLQFEVPILPSHFNINNANNTFNSNNQNNSQIIPQNTTPQKTIEIIDYKSIFSKYLTK